MKIKAFIIVACLFAFGCRQQQKAERWYKGNLHTHSYWSDGDEFPEMIMNWYKSNGYNFVALSDHNILAEGEHWYRISEKTIYQEAFQNYLQKYGDDWVTYKNDSGRLEVRLKTYSEYKSLFEKPGEFLILQSEEISDKFDGKPLHMNATNIQELIQPQGGTSVSDVLQRNIDAVLEQRKATGVPMIPHINHPNFYYAISLEDMLRLRGERFFEVYNGHPLVNNSGDSVHMSIEEMWDKINIEYISQNKPVMYGLATDDSHNYHQLGNKFSNAGRGWIMVYADSLDAPSIIKAMEDGQFYASTGVTLSQVSFKKNKLHIEIKPEQGVRYDIEFIGCYKGESKTKLLLHNRILKGEIQLDSNILFVRAKITSNKPMGNPVTPGEVETAWTQPFTFVRD